MKRKQLVMSTRNLQQELEVSAASCGSGWGCLHGKLLGKEGTEVLEAK